MSKQHAGKPDRDEPFDGEYIGNIWGKKFTVLGAVLIVFMVAMMYCQHKQSGTEAGFEKQEHPVDRVFDSDSNNE
ncbi:MAG: hypothetical protein HKN16_09445 [Saprospiraceae bacterium]|nr:hypothetical protein [Saprospiraceae bacterium]